MKFRVLAPHASGDAQHSLLVLECGSQCQIPLIVGPPKNSNVWGWDGNVETPTVSPSINCSKCGFHKTLTGGNWT